MKTLFYTFLFTSMTIPLSLANPLSIEINNSANKIWNDTISETWRGKYIQLRSTKNMSSPVDELRCSEDHGSRLSIAYSYKIKMSGDICLKLFEELKTKDLKKLKLFFKCSSKESCELISFMDLATSVTVSESASSVTDGGIKGILNYLSNDQAPSTNISCDN
jgi:hypothetical protein